MTSIHDRFVNATVFAEQFIANVNKDPALSKDQEIQAKLGELSRLADLTIFQEGTSAKEKLARGFKKLTGKMEGEQITKIHEKIEEIKRIIQSKHKTAGSDILAASSATRKESDASSTGFQILPEDVEGGWVFEFQQEEVYDRLPQINQSYNTPGSLEGFMLSAAKTLQSMEQEEAEPAAPPAEREKKTPLAKFREAGKQVKLARTAAKAFGEGGIEKQERGVLKRCSEVENTIKNYQEDIVILKTLLEHLDGLSDDELAARGGVDVKMVPELRRFIKAYILFFDKQKYAPAYSQSKDLSSRVTDHLNLLETDLRKNLSSSKEMAKLMQHGDFNLFLAKLQGSLTPADCSSICAQLNPIQKGRLSELTATGDLNLALTNSSTVSLIKAVQIPLKYPLFAKELQDSLKKLIKLQTTISSSKNLEALERAADLAEGKSKALIGLCGEINKEVETHKLRHEDVKEQNILTVLLEDNPATSIACLTKNGLRDDAGVINIQAVSKAFAKSTGAESLFRLFCKSLNVIDLGTILDSDAISDDLKNKIVEGIEPYHISVHPVKMLADLYKFTKGQGADLQEISRKKEEYSQLQTIAFKDWNPEYSYIGMPAKPQELSVFSENILPQNREGVQKTGMELYKDMITQLNNDVTDKRGNNIKISFKQNGMVVNKKAFDFFNELEGKKNTESIKQTLKKMGDIMISDADLGKYEAILKYKPDEVDPKEYIVAHMLYLGSQASQNQLSIRFSNRGFIPRFGKDAKDTDCLVDFDSAKVGLAQTARGILLNARMFYGDRKLSAEPILHPASLVVKMVYDCKKSANTPQASVLLYNRGRFMPEEFQKAFSR